MLATLPVFLRVPLVCILLFVSTVLHVLPLLVLTGFRLLLPLPSAERRLGAVLVWIAESWLSINSALFGVFTRTRWHVEGIEDLGPRENFLVVCNHQSWVDIPSLQKVFNRRIPFMRFFLKSELIWVPLLGPAWWALDFPFMKRHSRQQLEARPELRGKDREAGDAACLRKVPPPARVDHELHRGHAFHPGQARCRVTVYEPAAAQGGRPGLRDRRHG